MDKTRSKILIAGPFRDFGGREVEGNLVARTLDDKYFVSVFSTELMGENSAVLSGLNIPFSVLHYRLLRASVLLRVMAILTWARSGFKGKVANYVKNKTVLDSSILLKETGSIIEDLVESSDLIFLCAQLSTMYVREFLAHARELNKPIVIRVTGTVYSMSETAAQHFNEVDLFLMHSKRNSEALKKFVTAPVRVIDQTSLWEENLLQLPIVSSDIRTFGFLGRISEEKGILELIDLFTHFPEFKLEIAGEGPLIKDVLRRCEDYDHIIYNGIYKANEVEGFYERIDCLVICSHEESGPLVGLEAMAAGKLILSTDVGAMKERLQGTGNDFWFDLLDTTSFGEQLNRIIALNPRELEEIRTNNRKRYLEAYQLEKIAGQYKDCVDYLI
ncbi:MAG: glycosyltransferase [Flavobacterium sp.]|nr:MAG: glycosyltransferase [Flavobacterium sp.]